MDIVEFLRARLDEDEAVAKSVVIPAHDGHHPHPELSEWKVGSDGEVEYVAPVHEIPLHGGRVGVSSPYYVTMDHEGLSPSVEPDVARYIARHDPVRVLREVEAKRRIVDLHDNWPVLVEALPQPTKVNLDSMDTVTMQMARRMAWMTEQEYVKRFGTQPPTASMVRELAAIYADHPDYDPEWR